MRRTPQNPDARHRRFYRSLGPDERLIISIRDELYAGSWNEMLRELKDRVKARPIILDLVRRIRRDIARIEKLRDYEARHGMNLADCACPQDARRRRQA